MPLAQEASRHLTSRAASALAASHAPDALGLIQSRADALRRRESANGTSSGAGAVSHRSVANRTSGRAGAASHSSVAGTSASGSAAKRRDDEQPFPDIADGSWMPPPLPTTTREKLLWLLFPLPILGGFVAIWCVAGGLGLLRCVPIGLSVLLLLFVVDNQYLAPFMTRVHFAVGSACVTMVVVMEVSTLEAFFLKTVLRFLGTFFGAAMGVSLANLTGYQGNHPTLVVGISFVFFSVAKAMGSHAPKTNYFFTIASVTFALVFYTPSAAVGRFYSVLVGNVFAFLTTFFSSMLFADPYDPEISSLASLVCNGGRIVHAALRAVDLAFLELHIASAKNAEDVREYLQSNAGEHVQEFNTLARLERDLLEELKGCESLSKMLEIVSDRASKCREEFEKTRYQAKFKNDQFKNDVELLRWFCCIQSGTLPKISDLIAPADKVFGHANGLAHSVELHMNLGFHILNHEELLRVDQVRVLIESVGPYFAQAFDPNLWLPRTRWKAMLVLMAPGLISSRVGKRRPINRGAAIEAVNEISKALVAADMELSKLWKESLLRSSPRPPYAGGVVSIQAPEGDASQVTVKRHMQSMHLLYHGLHLMISDLGVLAKTVLSLQEAGDMEFFSEVGRTAEVLAMVEELRQAQVRLGGLTVKAGHRHTMVAQASGLFPGEEPEDGHDGGADGAGAEEGSSSSSSSDAGERHSSVPEDSRRGSLASLQEEHSVGTGDERGERQEEAARSSQEATGTAAGGRAEEASEPRPDSAAPAG